MKKFRVGRQTATRATARDGNPLEPLPGQSAGYTYLNHSLHSILARGRPSSEAGWNYDVIWLPPDQAADWCRAATSWAHPVVCPHQISSVGLSWALADPEYRKVLSLAAPGLSDDLTVGGRFQPDCTDDRGAGRVNPFAHATLLHLRRQPLRDDLVTVYWAMMCWARTFTLGKPYLYAHPVWLAHIHAPGVWHHLVWQWADNPVLNTFNAARRYAVNAITNVMIGD